MSGTDLHQVRRVTPADLPAIANIHLLSFPDSALTSLGVEAVRRYYHWQLTGPHDVVALCVVEGEEVTAFCFGGIFRGALEGFLRVNRRFLVWRVVTRPWVLSNEIVQQRVGLALQSISRRRRQPAVTKPLASSRVRSATFGILSIAVHPKKAGTGQGRCLIASMERVARERNFAGMHLTVSPSNRVAIAFYERLGWNRDLDKPNAWTGAMSKNLWNGKE